MSNLWCFLLAMFDSIAEVFMLGHVENRWLQLFYLVVVLGIGLYFAISFNISFIAFLIGLLCAVGIMLAVYDTFVNRK